MLTVTINRTGETLAKALSDAGFRVPELPCGGRGQCGKCRLMARGALLPPGKTEKRLLRGTFKERPDGFTERLACLAVVNGEAEVILPNVIESRTGNAAPDVTSSEAGTFQPDTANRGTDITRPNAVNSETGTINPNVISGKNSTNIPDSDRGTDISRPNAVNSETTKIKHDAANCGAGTISPNVISGKTSANSPDTTNCGADAPRPDKPDEKSGKNFPDTAAYEKPPELSAAVDIGTTNIEVSFFLPDGELFGKAFCPNPQLAFGADVISRVGAAGEHGNELHLTLVKAVRSLFERFGGEVRRAVVVGNTIMLHFFAGLDVSGLTCFPFRPTSLFGSEIEVDEIPDCRFFLPECLSAFIGADALATLLTTGQGKNETAPAPAPEPEPNNVSTSEPHEIKAVLSPEPREIKAATTSQSNKSKPIPIREPNKTVLTVDLGTNGEILLESGGKIYCASTAAGPALEGAGISCGMRAGNGAIDRVSLIDGKLSSHVIGDGKAEGVCGGGLISAVAAALDSGLIDESGYAEKPIRLAENVCLSEKDIRAFQLAKSAVRTGIQLLIDRAGVARIDKIRVAGGFGKGLDLDACVRTGLLPVCEKYEIIGNAALGGAEAILNDKNARKRYETIVRSAETIPLAEDPRFDDIFVENLLFR